MPLALPVLWAGCNSGALAVAGTNQHWQSQWHPCVPRPHSARRGVLLLLILALLAMFGLIAIAFVMLSGQAQRSAKSIERIELSSDPPQKVLQQAAMQLFRGSTSPASVMGAHGLLEDMYGNDWVRGTITLTASSSVCGGQLIEFTFARTSGATTPALRTGCVVTVVNPTTSPAYGRSSRIVGYNPTGDLSGTATGPWQMLAFDGSGQPQNGDEVVINGVPFSGTGFGYNPTSHQLNDTATCDPTHIWTVASNGGAGTLPVALLPNLPLSVYYNLATNLLSNPPGGANSDYTAADFQHMFLAAQVPNGATIQTLPSFHRPALVKYWMQNAPSGPHLTFGALWTSSAANQDLCRKIMMRPIGQEVGATADHPNFTGSNPIATGFDPINPLTWDVDNDGDGVPDSVWVDLGMPVRSTADGRLYKPLFAILCTDLDGRLNLNAHGSLPQSDAAGYNGIVPGVSTAQFAGGVTPQLPRGLGGGPAEIGLVPLFENDYPTYANNNYGIYRQLLSGDGTYEGRYGMTKVPGIAGTDLLNTNKWCEYGQAYWTLTTVNNAGSYGSPPDPFGVGAVGLDLAGRPIYSGMTYLTTTYRGFGSVTQDNPYEINLGPNAARGLQTGISTTNNLFSTAEFERILRPYDRDATSLSPRLAMLTAKTVDNPTTSLLLSNRRAITTESWDVPCPATVGGHITDLLAEQLIKKGLANKAAAVALLPTLCPPEFLAGLKMNINRPFGNGRDYIAAPGDDPNTANAGVVDAPGTQHQVKLVTKSDGTIANVNVSYDGLAYTGDSLQARQLEARYLYVLMCLVADIDYLKTQLGNEEEVARFIAQWAVNVVDFRDRDSIMTRFDYDPNFAYNDPAGHAVTGWITPNNGLHTVWGCERPELLISETLAFHARRTEDTAGEIPPDFDPKDGDDQDTPGKTTSSKTVNPPHSYDGTYDQTYRPQGSLFVELYNPSSAMEPRSGDLYNGPNGQLVLTKITPPPASGVNGSPVWRLVIATPRPSVSNPDAEQPDPDEPDPAKLKPDMEREVYFVDNSLVAVPPTLANTQGQFFPTNPSNTPTVVGPGGYAVIGPSEKGVGVPTPKRTYIGLRNGQTKGDGTTRYIDLDFGANVLLVQNNTNISADPSDDQIQQPARITIDTPRRLSVSEPIGGYDLMEIASNKPDVDGHYGTPYDAPFDGKRDDDGTVFQGNGTVPNYRVVYLQRLANPLLPFNDTPTDPNYNPYRTIDMMAVDVTAFNGVCDDTNDPKAGLIVPMIQTHFQSRQRGEKNDLANGLNLWKQEPVAKADADFLPDAPNLTGHYFNQGLKNSLGYLNQPFGAPTDGTVTPGYEGDPLKPFPWLTWNNRPFVSPLELLMVPALRSSKLLVNAGKDTSDANYNKYFCTVPAAGTPQPYAPTLLSNIGALCPTLSGADVLYPHLLNFFQSTAGTSPQFHRILEYLRVPSPFGGAEIQADPTSAQANPGTHAFHPPFNWISTYREPGRINLNTIYGDRVGNPPEVWQGLMFNFPDMNTATFWQKFAADRGMPGYMPTTSPTEIGHPYRSFGGGQMVPIAGLNPFQNREVNATLLREDSNNAGHPLFEAASSQVYNDTDRNPFFRYQGLERLGNLVTTRSNVFAVWITVGYFEVEPASALPSCAGWTAAQLQAVYPDGYALGRELGADTGEIDRHRAFYIFDRTIPVGFQRGQDMNVEKAILVNRYIE